MKVGDIVETTLPNGNNSRGIVLEIDVYNAKGLVRFVTSKNEMVYSNKKYVKVLNKQ